MTDSPTERADRKIDEAQRVYERHGKVFRTVWVLTGVVIVAAGLAMTVFPGPVTVVVPAGLAMLAAVFGWARWLLLQTVEKGVEAKHYVDRASTKAKVLGVLALACLVVAAGIVALAWFDIWPMG
jgi:uncharacterized protein (TIGR02611 family)